jgi:primosomal protein N'
VVKYFSIIIKKIMDEQTANPQGEDDTQATPPASGGGEGAQPPAGDQGAQPTGGQPPAGQKGDQKDLSGIMEENVDISSLVAGAGDQKQVQDFITSVKVLPHPNTKFDEKKFVELLAGSISLTITEKKRIIEAIPQLSQFQIDELIKIFEEEKSKFSELEKKHAEQVKELEGKHKESWQDLESQKEEEKKKGEEEKEAEDIKKKLGI